MCIEAWRPKALSSNSGNSHYEPVTIDVDDINVVPHAEGVDPVAALDPQGAMQTVGTQEPGVALFALPGSPQRNVRHTSIDNQNFRRCAGWGPGRSLDCQRAAVAGAASIHVSQPPVAR